MDNKAIKDLKSDKVKAVSRNDLKELSKICNCLGRKYLQTLRYSEAIDEHRQELDISLQIGCRLSEAVARRALGECLAETNDYHKALTQHRKYLELSKSLANDIEIQRAYATIGRTHLLHAQEVYNTNNEINKEVLTKAKDNFSKALNLSERLTNLTDRELAEMQSRLYLNLGLVFEIMGRFTEAMSRFHLAINLNRKFSLTEDLFRCQLSLAGVYEKNNDFEKSLEAYDEALKSCRLLKNKTNSCDTLIGKGLVLMRLQRFEDSRKCFKKAYKLHSPIDDDHQKAIRYLKISSIICDDFREFSQTDDSETKLNLSDKLGDHFVELKLFDIAIDFYKKELNFGFQCNKSDTEMAKIYVSIAQTYADNLQYNEAIDYFKHELDFNCGNNVEESKSLIKIAEMTEYLDNEELYKDIIDSYEKAIEKVGDNDDNWLIDILQRYKTYLQNRRLNNDKVFELNERIKEVSRRKTTEIEKVDEEEEEEDVYDNYNLNHLSDLSDDSDDEETSGSHRRKRMGKQLKLNEKGETPLHLAVINGNLKQVERLLADNHPVNITDSGGWTPLHEATNHGRIEIAGLLLAAGADINENSHPNCEGITPLHDACFNGHFDIVRLLLKRGANITILAKDGVTVLDSLRDWKQRCAEEDSLTDDQFEEFKLLEKELDDGLKRLGFVRPILAKNVPTNKATDRRRAHKPLIRNQQPSAVNSDSDDSLDFSIHKSMNSRQNTLSSKSAKDMPIDIDNPRTARREYKESISNLRRNHDLNVNRPKPRPKGSAIPALINESNIVDEWLIKDTDNNKKRSCLDAYEAFPKRSKTGDMNSTSRRKPTKPRTSPSKIQDIDMQSSDNNSNSDVEECGSVVSSANQSHSQTSKQLLTKTSEEIRPNLKPIQMRVCVGDSDNSLFVIPIHNRSSNCLWLNKEVEKRYFNKFGVKPVLSLQTTDGALLSDEDCVLDVVIGNELKVNAKIVSWVMDPLPDRYKQICKSTQIAINNDILNELELTQINGCLKLCDVSIPSVQICAIFRALQRQSNLKEIDISSSNIIFEDSVSFLNCLPFLPSLQILNLKCTSIGLQTLEQLLTKSCPNLVDLNLSFNTFGDYYSDIIVKLIKHFSKLIVLDLSACDLTNQFIPQLNDLNQNSSLRSVIMGYNTIDSDLIEKFKKL